VRHQLTDDIEHISLIPPCATRAAIKKTVNEALIHSIGEGRDTITWPDMLAAKHVEQHGLPDDWEYIQGEGHAVAIHEACHAVAFYRLSTRMTIDVATIERAATPAIRAADPDRGPSACGSQTRDDIMVTSRRSPASACSSTATTPRGSVATWVPPISRWRWKVSTPWAGRSGPIGSRDGHPG
jgi:hypothetical protein